MLFLLRMHGKAEAVSLETVATTIIKQMHMWFWFGNNLGSFLFPGYNVTTTWSLVCTCLGLTALAILYEWMKILQMKLQQSTMVSVQRKTARTLENCSLLSKISQRSIGTSSSRYGAGWFAWSFKVFHWSIHTSVGYILMMAVMTYNVYINIALVLGGCIGYWIFGPKLRELNMARFYERQRSGECDKECADNILNHQRQGSTISIVAEQLVTEATIEVHQPRDI